MAGSLTTKMRGEQAMLRFLRLGAGILSMVLATAVMAQEPADTVYINGNIYTVDEDFSTASAFAIKDGSFIYVR